MPGNDELGMDMSQMAEAAKQAVVEAEVEAPRLDESAPELEATIEVDNDSFWDDSDEELDLVASEDAEDSEADPAADSEEDVPSQESDAIVTYKVNGKDVTLDLDEVRNSPEAREQLAKDLALVGGAKKAFSKAALLQKEQRKLQKQLDDARSYKEAWDKLEAIKEDEAEVFQAITGRSLDEVIAERAEREYRYQNATDEERKILEYEDRIRRMELAQKKEADRRAKELEELNRTKFETNKKALSNDLQKEATKYDFEGVTPEKANRLRKMLWQSAIDDIKRYTKQGYRLNEKMIGKAFRDNAAALEGFYKTSVDRGIKAATQKRSAVAKEKAAEAATKNYKRPDLNKLMTKDPLSLFKAFTRK